MNNQTKLILKGIAVDGTPFAKEIRSLDEVKSSGNYVVVCKNATIDNGLPQINGKSHSCFCCEAQLTVTCCYSEDEAQSNTAYGQTLTICDRESGATNTYTRTISPGKNNGKWSEWQMVAIGDIQLIEQNNNIVNAFSEISKEIDIAVSSATTLHFNYMGNYPFSQKVIDAGIDKMIIAGYLDIDYEDGKAYCFSIISKENNSMKLYKKEKDLIASNSGLKFIADFNVAKIDGSPYYLAKSTSNPRSWIVLDWDDITSEGNMYDYDGIALSPSLFKAGGLSGKIEQINTELSESIIAESSKINNRIDSVEDKLNEVYYSELDYNNSPVVNQFQTSNKVGEQMFKSSTFSGTAMYVGKLAPFRYILSYFKCGDWVESPKSITKILLQIRQNDYDGEILYNQFVDIVIKPGEIKPVMIDMGEIKTFTGNLYIALRADSISTAMLPANSNYPFDHAGGNAYPKYRYWTYGNIDIENKGSINEQLNRNFYFQTFTVLNEKLTLTDVVLNDIQTRLNLNPNIEISLPNRIVAVVGDTLQLFYRGIIGAVNPYNYDIKITCPKGKQTPRYFEYTPKSSDTGNVDFKIEIKDNNGVLIASKTCKVHTVLAAKSPTNNTKVLCLGDSLTTNGEWVKECYRRLSAIDGTPTGNGLSNIEFCGSKKGGGAGWFGLGGWNWKTYTSAGTPAFRFYVSGVSTLSVGAVYSHNGYSYKIIEVNVTSGTGNILCETSSIENVPTVGGTLTKISGNGDAAISFDEYKATVQNPLWDSVNNKMSFIPYANEVSEGRIDAVYTLLSWNGLSANMTAEDFGNILSMIRTFANTLHSEFPNAKLKLMGQNPPSLKGGMGANYGATGCYSDSYGMLKTILRMNEVYQNFANSEGYSHFVEFVNVSSQFDVENNMQSAEFAVNTRNSKTELLDTNGVHPANEGYMQIADVVYRNLVANYCQ